MLKEENKDKYKIEVYSRSIIIRNDASKRSC